MPTTKRKAPEPGLHRRVKARREYNEDVELLGSPPDSSSLETARIERGDLEGGKYHESESEALDTASDDAPSISFGALAKAQNTLSNLGGSRRSSKQVSSDVWKNNEASERRSGREDNRDFNRTNKHAPTEISSKKAVSRRREVVPVIKREHRDPRFDPLAGPVDESKVKAAYSFLDEYREVEMKELKATIKATKDEETRERLKRAYISLESKKKAQERKRKEDEILHQHRKEEKELVRQGKKPFYLKKAEQKRRMLLDRFSGLKGKQLDHVIERRRKKLEGREKRELPFKRRGVE